MQPNKASVNTSIPRSALILGVLGLIPFVVSAIASWLAEGFLQAQAWYTLTAYGAVILSFLGGVHWGIGLSMSRQPDHPSITPRLLISIVPSLIGWAALLMPTQTGLIAMALAFVAMLITDLDAARRDLVPRWYLRLRRPLSVVVVVCLLFGAAA